MANTSNEKELQQDSKDGFSKEYLEQVAVMQSFLSSDTKELYLKHETPFFIYKDALYFAYRRRESKGRGVSGSSIAGKLHKYTFINNRLVKYSYVGIDLDYVIAGFFSVFVSFGALIEYFGKGNHNIWIALGILIFAALPIVGVHLTHLWAKKKMETVWNTKRNYIPVKKSL